MQREEAVDMLAIKSINGVQPVIQPLMDGYNVTKADLYSDSTKRTAETGTLILTPIRFNVYSIELKFKGTSAEISAVDSLISGNAFEACFLFCGEYVTKNMYASDRIVTDNGLTAELSVSFIEI